MSGYDKPNYTQIPNELLDEHIAQMNEAELRVTLAICRKTFGWQKKRDVISLSQLETLTGMSRQGVINGVGEGLERGTIRRYKHGQSYAYAIIVKDATSQPSRPVEPPTSQPSGLAEDGTSQPSGLVLPKTSQPSRHTKESIKEIPTGTAAPFDAFLAWCRGLKIDPKTVPKTEKNKECRYGKELIDAGWPLEDIESCTQDLRSQEYWSDHTPSLANVAKEISQWKQRQDTARTLMM